MKYTWTMLCPFLGIYSLLTETCVNDSFISFLSTIGEGSQDTSSVNNSLESQQSVFDSGDEPMLSDNGMYVSHVAMDSCWSLFPQYTYSN